MVVKSPRALSVAMQAGTSGPIFLAQELGVRTLPEMWLEV